MVGRPKKPLKVRASEGDRRKIGKKKLESLIRAEPKTQSGLPACPEHVTGLAREAWERWTLQLQIMELDRQPDAEMLEGACIAYQRAVIADQEIKRDGITIKTFKETDEGEVILLSIKTHPAIKVSTEAWRQVKSFCTEFGFSPASRSRLAVAKQNTPVDIKALLLADDAPIKSVH